MLPIYAIADIIVTWVAHIEGLEYMSKVLQKKTEFITGLHLCPYKAVAAAGPHLEPFSSSLTF